MKTMKKTFALLLAVVMALALAMPAVAAGPTDTTLKVAPVDGHTYTAYQLFVGELANDGSTLSNVKYGTDVKASFTLNNKDYTAAPGATVPAEILDYLKGLNGRDLEGTPKDFAQTTADIITSMVDTSKDGTTLSATETTVKTGYYVVVDSYTKDPPEGDVAKTTLSTNVVEVVGPTEVKPKAGNTTDVKTIVADTLGKDSGENAYDPGKDNDNVSIGDTVKYNIAATVPENASQYKPGTFYFVITDKLSDGLDFTTGSIEVYDGTTKLTENTHYSVQYDVNGNTFEIGLVNAASYAGHTINVKYAAVLNKDAVIGDEGNPNTSTVKFSNDPNKTYNGTPTDDEDHPGFPDSTYGVPMGETPKTETKTYVTGIEIQKVDENGKPLQGVTFELSGQSAKKVVTKTETFEEDADGTYYKLNNGKYTTTAPSAQKMVPAEAGATAGYVQDDNATGDGVIEYDGHKYRAYVPEEDTGMDIYVLQQSNESEYASTTTKYKKVVAVKTEDTNLTDHKMSESVDANGLVRFDGLGAGKYTITETAWPDGYNTVDPIEFTVTYNESGEAKFTCSDNAKVVYDDAEGIFKIEIVNEKGSVLPETGGIGTKMFYTMGAVLVIGAGVILVSRKRAGE